MLRLFQIFFAEELLTIEFWSSLTLCDPGLLPLIFFFGADKLTEFELLRDLNFWVIFFSKILKVSFFFFSLTLLCISIAEPLLEPVADKEPFLLLPRADPPWGGISG
jgi:hypothetical protein